MSTLRVDTLQTKAGQEVYTAKAWVNFNGTGTVAIRGSGNVSSITDIGVGQYQVNFTNAFEDTNYSFLGHAGHTTSNDNAVSLKTAADSWTTTSVGVLSTYANSSSFGYWDVPYGTVAIFR